MLRRHHRFFLSVQVIRDALLTACAFGAAYWLRFVAQLTPFDSAPNQSESWFMLGLVVMVWPLVAWVNDLYVSHRTRSLVAEGFDVTKATCVAFLILVTVTYFWRDERYSRAMFLLWAGFHAAFVTMGRIVSRMVLRDLRRRGFNLRHVLVVGIGELATRVIATVHAREGLGLRVEGIVAAKGDAACVGEQISGVPVLGTVDQLSEILATKMAKGNTIDQVVVALPIEKLSALKPIMRVLSQETVDVRLVPDVYQYVTLCGSIEEFGGLPLINLQATPLAGWSHVVKRTFDVVVATMGMILSAPVMLAIAAVIWAGNRGPVFFTQVRVGLDGRRFKMHKFRTMVLNAEVATRWTTAKDQRCTPWGRWLRRLSLDELPQLWNVITGDMSLVGPRPEQPELIEDFKQVIPRYALRHKIKSGMTGWAQVNGLRGDTSIKKRIELDLYYIENWSLLLDMKILIRTVLGGFLSPNAY